MAGDRYEIKQVIGEGGAGSVYLALDTRLNREVAIKRLISDEGTWNQETVDNMLEEARLLSSLDHPNIVTIYDVDVGDEGPYVVMELLQGRNIDDLIAENTLTASDFQEFAKHCLEALSAAHAVGIIHRDIKPNNIVLKWLPNGKFQAKLLDFGMAKLSRLPSKQTVDQSDAVLGSIYFMAPEQFERTELDFRTDIYALGSVFYYTLTGYYPFTGNSPAEVMAAHLTHKVTPVSELRPDLPEWLCNWVMWMINREQQHRPDSADTAMEYFNANNDRQPLKQSSSVSNHVQPGQTYYFGQNDDSVYNKAATKVNLNAEVATPTLLTASGKLTIQNNEQAVISSENITQPLAVKSPSTTRPIGNKIKRPAAPTTPIATRPTPTTPHQETAGGRNKSLDTKPLTPPGSAPKPQTSTQPVRATGVVTSRVSASGTPVVLPTNQQTVQVKQKTNFLPLIVVVIIALITCGGIAFVRIGQYKQAEIYKDLLNQAEAGQTDIPTSTEELELLLSKLYANSGQVANELLYKRLAVAEGQDGLDVDVRIAEFATSSDGALMLPAREALFRVIGRRQSASVMPTIHNFIEKEINSEIASTAISSTKQLASSDDLLFYTSILLNTKESTTQKAAEQVVAHLVKQNRKNKSVGPVLKNALNEAEGPLKKAAITRLLGNLGDDQAKNILLKSLESSDKALVIPALTALKHWPEATVTVPAIDFWELSTETSVRKYAFETVYELLKKYHTAPKPQNINFWKRVSEGTINSRERSLLISALGNTRQKYAISIIEPYLTHPDKVVSRKAKSAIDHIKLNTK